LWLICLAGEGVSAWRWGYKLKRISDTIRSGSMQRRPSAMAHSECQGLDNVKVFSCNARNDGQALVWEEVQCCG